MDQKDGDFAMPDSQPDGNRDWEWVSAAQTWGQGSSGLWLEAPPASPAAADPKPFDWEPRMSYVPKRPQLQAGVASAAGTVAAASEVEAPLVVHRGRCHCGRVRFEVDAPSAIVAWDCNCTICAMKRNVHFIVPGGRLRLLSDRIDGRLCDPWRHLQCYTFKTHTAQHLFCKYCGVVPFYRPRSNPDGWAVTVHCLEPGTVATLEVRFFDGSNWEGFIGASGIQALSKA